MTAPPDLNQKTWVLCHSSCLSILVLGRHRVKEHPWQLRIHKGYQTMLGYRRRHWLETKPRRTRLEDPIFRHNSSTFETECPKSKLLEISASSSASYLQTKTDLMYLLGLESSAICVISQCSAHWRYLLCLPCVSVLDFHKENIFCMLYASFFLQQLILLHWDHENYLTVTTHGIVLKCLSSCWNPSFLCYWLVFLMLLWFFLIEMEQRPEVPQNSIHWLSPAEV